jgi:hypothetical protein
MTNCPSLRIAALTRHCEASSAVAIQVFVQRLMDCFVPRNDGIRDAMTNCPSLRGAQRRGNPGFRATANGLLRSLH